VSFKKTLNKLTVWAIALIVVVVGYVYFSGKGVPLNLSRAQGKLESHVTDILVKHGIQQKDVFETISEEKKSTGFIPQNWITTQRKILSPSHNTSRKIAEELRLYSIHHLLSISYLETQTSKATLEIRYGNKLLQSLIFLKKKALNHQTK